MTHKHIYPLSIALAILAVLVCVYALYVSSNRVYGSVSDTDEYQATTTNPTSVAIRNLKVGPGSLAQITVTGVGAGTILVYNATTSDVNLRTGQKATSTITLAEINSSLAAGTYTFDARFTDGLLVVTSGAAASSTVTWR